MLLYCCFVFRGVALKRVQTPSLACVPCVTICVSTALFAFNHTFIPQLTVKEVTSAFSLCKLKMSKKQTKKKPNKNSQSKFRGKERTFSPFLKRSESETRRGGTGSDSRYPADSFNLGELVAKIASCLCVCCSSCRDVIPINTHPRGSTLYLRSLEVKLHSHLIWTVVLVQRAAADQRRVFFYFLCHSENNSASRGADNHRKVNQIRFLTARSAENTLSPRSANTCPAD